MRLPRFAIQNYQFVLILVLLAILTGVYSYVTMPRSEDPILNIPTFSVVAIYPGASPEDMEELIADPIEEAIDELDDIDKIKTRIDEGLMVIRVDANFGIDIDDKYDEVSSTIYGLRSTLPEGIFQLDVNQFSPFDVVIMQLALVSDDAEYSELYAKAEELKDRIKGLDGIRAVKIDARPEQEIRVDLDFSRMAAMQIPLNQVAGIIQGNNANIPGGDFEAGVKSFSLKTSGSYKDLESIRNTIVSAGRGQVVRLKDVASVEYADADIRWKGRFEGEKCVYVSVTLKEGFNILTVTDALKKKLTGAEKAIPAGMRLEVAFEQAPAVASRVNDFFLNLLQGILLVGAVILIFLGLRPSLVIMTVIPVSILIAIGVLNLNSFGIQQISIAGLVIALGLLVDNGIVVLENILRYQREGLPLREAALKGTSEVGVAIISSTATTLLAFFPLTQLGEATGEFLKTLPLIVIYALLASLVLALTFTPILAGRFVRQRSGKRWVLRQMDRIIERGYQPVLRFVLRRPAFLLIGSLLAVGGAFSLFPKVGVSFFPTADKPLLLVDINTPVGSSLERTDEAVRFVEQVLDSAEYVQSYHSNTGHGNPQVYYNRPPEYYRKSHGQVVANLKAWDPEQFYTMLGHLRRTFREYAGAKITLKELKNGPPFLAPIEIKILGQNLDTLKQIAADVEGMIEGTEGTLNVRNPFRVAKTDLRVAINREKAGLLGMQLADIDLAVRTALSGYVVDQVSMSDGEEYDVSLYMDQEGELSVRDLQQLYVASGTGAQIPLRQVADLRFEKGVSRIGHFNLQRSTSVYADVYDSDKTAAITGNVIEKLEAYTFPEGYAYYVAGELETQNSSFGSLGSSLVLALIAIFAVLVLQFRSVAQPLIVFSAIPFAFIGSILALYITGWSFSFFAFVGFTSLVGIVVNNSIILVDYTNQLRDSGMTKREAILSACRTRFTPIVLTSMTTILGLLPLTLSQSGLWSPLGWTIIGGMVTSTILVLLIVPILYQAFTRERKAAAVQA